MTPSHPALAVTGVTGALGGRVARRLAAADVPQRLLVRDPARAPRVAHSTLAVAEYGDAAAAEAALRGVDTLLMVSASESPHRRADHETFVSAAVHADVAHLIYISFYGAAPDSTFTLARDHAATEQAIRDSGLGFTILRDNLYADSAPMLAGEDRVIRGPAGDGRVSLVARDDIADAAVTVLLDPAAHAGQVYSLTGPRSLTLTEVAEILTAESNPATAYRYEPETVSQAYASRAVYRAPDWQLEAWVSTYEAIAAGELDGVTADIPLLTGHPATSLAEVVRRQGPHR